MIFQPLTQHHYPFVRKLYEQAIALGNSTFQTSAPEWEEWNVSYLASGRIVGIENNKLIGWAALMPVSEDPVYSGVAEVIVCVDETFQGKGYGTHLLDTLIQESEKSGFWTLQVTTFPENEVSIRMYEVMGFRQIGFRQKIGKLNGAWRDTVLFERRSAKIGL